LLDVITSEGSTIKEKSSLSWVKLKRVIITIVIKKHLEVKRDIAKQSMMCSWNYNYYMHTCQVTIL
jgi:hypothetical protein